jgi:hypothetical protein
MRKLALLLLGGLILVQAGGASTAAPKYLPMAMRFVDRAHGYVELVPQLKCPSCRLKIAETTDGGLTWRPTGLTKLPLPLAEQHFRTTWRNGTRRGLRLAAVVNSRVAWGTSGASSGPFGLFLSRDGGLSWRKAVAPYPTPTAFWPPLVSAPTAEHAWVLVLGQPGAGQQRKALYETTDARHWRLRWRFNGSGYGESIAFSETGFGLLGELRGGLLVTRDGGRRWRLASITSPEIAEPQALAVFGRRSIVLVRDDRRGRVMKLYRSDDAGRRWRPVHAWR